MLVRYIGDDGATADLDKKNSKAASQVKLQLSFSESSTQRITTQIHRWLLVLLQQNLSSFLGVIKIAVV